MNASQTRILPLPHKSEHAFISMPNTAWYWLDDLVETDYPGGYKDLMQGFQAAAGSAQDLAIALRRRAENHATTQMAGLYNLANDNQAEKTVAFKNTPTPEQENSPPSRMPSLYQLFRFLPHPTALTTVWERRNYHLKPRQ